MEKEEYDYEDDCRDRYKRARDYATEKHIGQFRIGGEEYITHPLAVCVILLLTGNFQISKIVVALLHDVLEDTDSTVEEMKERTELTPEELKAVVLLTKEKGFNKSEYMKRVKENNLARVVKVADRIHNLQSSLTEGVTDSFRRRYIKESREYFIEMSEGTGMEEMLLMSIEQVEEKVMGAV